MSPERDDIDEVPEACDPLAASLGSVIAVVCDLTEEGSQARKAALIEVLELPARVRAAISRPRMH